MVRRQDVPIFMVNMVVVIHSRLVGKKTFWTSMVRRQDVPIFMVNMVVVIHSRLIGKENF